MASLLELFTLRRAKTYSNPGNPSETLKLVYGAMTDGELGPVPCVQIQKWNGATDVWQICDDPISNTTPTVYVDDIPTPAGWTFSSSTNFESQGNVAILTFASDMTGKRVSVKCSGILNSGGNVISNWAEIIYDAMVVQHGLTTDWDAVSYTKLFNTCAALALVGGGVIDADIDPVGLCNEILQPIGGAYPGGDGTLKLFVETLPTLPVPAEIFDEYEVNDIRWRESSAKIINTLKVKYRKSWTKQVLLRTEDIFDGIVEDSDPVSIREFNIRVAPNPFEAPWSRTDAVAATVKNTILSLYKRPRKEITVELEGSKAILQEQADPVAFSHRKFPGGSALGQPGDRRVMRVTSVSIQPRGKTISLTGYDLGSNWFVGALLWDGSWYLDGTKRLGGNP